jgi:hypothetical protein
VSLYAGPVPLTQPTASRAAQAQIAESSRQQQAWQVAWLLSQITSLWGLLDLRNVISSWPQVRTSITAVIGTQSQAMGQAGNAYYQQARSAAGVVTLPPLLSVPPPPPPELVTATLDSTGPYSLLKRIKAGQPVPQAAQATGNVMASAATRLIQNGARTAVLQAVQQDSAAVAWYRVTAADPCAWCALLAGRGAVYKTAQTAGFKAHSRCRCSAAAAFSREDAKALRDNDLYRQWRRVTRGFSGPDAVRAWRRYWDKAHPDAVGAPRVA